MLKWICLCALSCVCFADVSAETKVLAFSGSTRENSYNQKLVKEAALIAQQMGANVTVVDLKDYPLPFFNEDLEAQEGIPAKGQELRNLMAQSQVILIASPEYNGSLSAVLKNEIDWASREDKNGPSRAFKGKKFVIMSASPGGGGGTRGLAHLRNILGNVGGIVVEKQVTVPNAYNAFDDQGNLKDGAKKRELQDLVRSALN